MKSCYKCGTSENLLENPVNGANSYGCRPCNAARMKTYYDAAKLKVFDYYGNVCNCCGEDELFFLTIDHVNNDGNLERWKHGRTIRGRSLYVKIANSGFPERYQLLCMNCNFGKRMNNGTCPHNDV